VKHFTGSTFSPPLLTVSSLPGFPMQGQLEPFAQQSLEHRENPIAGGIACSRGGDVEMFRVNPAGTAGELEILDAVCQQQELLERLILRLKAAGWSPEHTAWSRAPVRFDGRRIEGRSGGWLRRDKGSDERRQPNTTHRPPPDEPV